MKLRSYFAPLLMFAVVSSVPTAALSAIQVLTNEDAAGRKFIVIEGEFDATQNLAPLYRTIVSFGPDFVAFNSPGGSVYSAMELGRFLRDRGYPTVQIRALECASACSLAFLGGVARAAEPGSIGVHKTSFADPGRVGGHDLVSAVQGATADILSYLREMGVAPELLELSLRYESSDIRYLSASEMAEFRVTVGPAHNVRIGETPGRIAPAREIDESAAPSTAVAVTIPEPHSGVARHPKGSILVYNRPAEDSRTIAQLPNGTKLTIMESIGGWYKVGIAGAGTGYAHSTGIKVDQFVNTGFNRKFVQIKSFKTEDLALDYAQSFVLPAAAYLSNNGWYAITLSDAFSDADATSMLNVLKSTGLIPSDSFKTYGNTYVTRVCCE